MVAVSRRRFLEISGSRLWRPTSKVSIPQAIAWRTFTKGIDRASVAAQTLNLPLTLSVSATQETVTVSAEAPNIETSKVERSTYIDSQSLKALPTNGRNFLDFVTLTPGVSIVQGPDGNEISINGQKGINNNVSIDGAENNNPFFGE